MSVIRTLLSILLLLLCNKQQTIAQKLYAKEFIYIDTLCKKSLSKSALATTDSLLARIEADSSNPFQAQLYLKAFIYQNAHLNVMEEEALEKSIQRFEDILYKLSPDLQAITYSYLAELYRIYLFKVYHKNIKRTDIEDTWKKDIREWTNKQLMSKTISLYHLSIKEVNALQRPLSDYWLLLTPKPGLESIIMESPTLYDLLHGRVIDFFNNRSSATQYLSGFILTEAAAFANLEDFLQYRFEATDSLNFIFNEVQSFKALLSFHLAHSRPKQIQIADIKRVAALYSISVHPDKDSLYINALQRYLQTESLCKNQARLLLADFYSKKAESYIYNDSFRWYKKKAYELALEVLANKPNRFFNYAANNLIEKIRYPQFSISTEAKLWSNQKNLVKLRYENIDTLYYKIIKLENKNSAAGKYLRYHDKHTYKYYTEQPFFLEEALKLPNEGDFQQHELEFILDTLPLGNYILLASKHADFKADSNAVALLKLQVTNLAVFRKNTDFYVVDRKTGMPLDKVLCNVYRAARPSDSTYNSDLNILLEAQSTDKNGKVRFQSNFESYRDYLFSFKKGEDNLVEAIQFYDLYYEVDNKYMDDIFKFKNYLYTDRSIYRPGQKIYYKGIATESDNSGNKRLKTKHKLTVQFYDNNNKLIVDSTHITNEYGSYSGSFTAPLSGLTGRMMLKATENDEYDYTEIWIEAYKRPKFEIKILPHTTSFQLGDTAFFKGYVRSFSGFGMGNASIKYSIYRQHRENELILEGNMETDAQGNFKIPFLANGETTTTNDFYNFELKLSITDINGETVEKKAILKVGSSDLVINFAAALEQDIESIFLPFLTKTRNNHFIASTLTYTIDLLKKPDGYYIQRLWEESDYNIISKEALKNTFPYYKDKSEFEPENWPSLKTIEQGTFLTEATFGKIPINRQNWEQGHYRIRISGLDSFGNEVKEVIYIKVYDQLQKEVLAVNALELRVIYPEGKNSAASGETVFLSLETASLTGIHALMLRSNTDKNDIEKWLFVNGRLLIPIKIKENDQGGFYCHFQSLQLHRFFIKKVFIRVPWEGKQLKIEYVSMRNAVEPGSEESWELKISGEKKDKVAAELLAGMYDASLDALFEQKWSYWHYPSNYSGENNSVTFVSSFYNYSIQSTANKFGSLYSGFFNIFINSDLDWFIFSTFGEYNLYLRSHHDQVFIEDTLYIGSWDLDKLRNVRDFSSIRQILFNAQYDNGEYSSFSGGRNNSDDTYIDGVRVIGGVGIDEAEIIEYAGFYKPGKVSEDHYFDDKVNKKTLFHYDVSSNTNDKVHDFERIKINDKPDFSDISIRKNLAETVFFYPHLHTDKKGNVILKFTMNEALTRWKLRILAHSKDMRVGYSEREVVTEKRLMVMPNPPRFLRQGDTLYFPAKVVNLSEEKIKGQVVLQLLDAATENPINKDLGNFKTVQDFNIKSKASANFLWKIVVPKDWDKPIVYRILAKSDSKNPHTDGEQNFLPVLGNRMLVTESMPITLRGGESKTQTFKSLEAANSPTLQPHKYVLEFTQNPAWSALQALPYLMEYPHECSEQLFSRFYANALASQVLNSTPRIKAVFEQWKNAGELELSGRLMQNEGLKSAILEETPWILEATNEANRLKNLAQLFDLHKMSAEQETVMKKLKERQSSNGGFPWFSGGKESWYITQHIAIQIRHLNKLGVFISYDAINLYKKAQEYCDNQVLNNYKNLLKSAGESKDSLSYLADYTVSELELHYLYLHSFIADSLLKKVELKEAVAYFRQQAAKAWQKESLLMQGKIALILHRANPTDKTALLIMQSLKERAIQSEELGMYWKTERGYYWYQAPIETHALLIEAFDEILKDSKSVEEMKIWLLANKQTNAWSHTKATAAAAYALLLTGDNWTLENKNLKIKVGKEDLDLSKREEVASTDYFKTTWDAASIKKEMATVTIENPNKSIALGAVYWQYFEDLDKINSFKETPLKIDKQLYKEISNGKEPLLRLITDTTQLQPGDRVIARIEIRVDRDMEYVHLKDMRASGFEPINVLSSYKYQGGLGYYESTRDASTNFFFDYLPKGTHVFEYPLRVNHRGAFSNGVTTIQCMYAPEFTSHSEGVRVTVK